MGWVRIDDSFYDHPKLIGLDACEIGLWVVMLAWSNRYMTDGYLPAAAVKRFQHELEPERLVTAGLWTEETDGYRIHDYLDYQPSAESQKERREKDKERARARRGEVDPAVGAVSSPENSTDDVLSESTQSPNGVRTDSDRSPPGIPLPRTQAPSPTDSLRSSDGAQTNGQKRTKTKSTRIPDPFTVTDEMREWADREIPGFDWQRESRRFLDYYRAAPDAKGLKRDWPATWRNWMRNNAEGKFAR